MYCSNCGRELKQDDRYCPYCGTAQNNYQASNYNSVNDTGSIWWGVLGFFVPIVGIVLYFVWKGEQPKNAKVSLKGALISIIISIVLVVLYVVWIIALISGGIINFY